MYSKATVSFFMTVCLSVLPFIRTEEPGSYGMGFYEFDI